MTREEFIKRAREFNYPEEEIKAILNECDEVIKNAPEGFEFDYDMLLLFEQPTEEM